MDKPNCCPFCESTEVRFVPSRDSDYARMGEADKWLVECPVCGDFALEDGAQYGMDQIAKDRRYRVSAVIREATIRKTPLFLGWAVADKRLKDYTRVQINEACESRFPRSIGELLDRALLNLSRLSEHPGAQCPLKRDIAPAIVFARNNSEMTFYGDALKKAGWIELSSMAGSLDVQLTPQGWVRITELERGRTGEVPTQAFVAMWFGNDEDQIARTRSRQFLADAFLKGFQVGIEQKARYTARRIDFKEFNDDIMDEIIAEIRKSRFVVADFTGHRAGVYYEAGFARGLGLPVIFTCHKDHIASAHFDTNHMNHITWATPEELAQKLANRIVATIGQGPLPVGQSAAPGQP